MCQGSLLRTQGLATSRDIKYFLSYYKVDYSFLAWRNDSSWERHAPCPLVVPHKVFLASHASQLDHLGDIYQWISLSRARPPRELTGPVLGSHAITGHPHSSFGALLP